MKILNRKAKYDYKTYLVENCKLHLEFRYCTERPIMLL